MLGRDAEHFLRQGLNLGCDFGRGGFVLGRVEVHRPLEKPPDGGALRETTSPSNENTLPSFWSRRKRRCSSALAAK